jgi:hypothetical protein
MVEKLTNSIFNRIAIFTARITVAIYRNLLNKKSALETSGD